MDDDDLTEVQKETLRETLHTLAATLTEGLEMTTESARIVDLDQPIGRISRVDAIQQQKLAQANKARLRHRLLGVRAAIVRAEQDPETFGECQGCGDDIAFKRLEARPESTLCIDCQSEQEGSTGRRPRRR